MSIKYVSLCSGIEAASVAWDVLGFEPLAFAEVEPYPSAVLAHRYPDVPNLGDIANVDWSKYRGTAQLVVGGTPCQAFSISGKRGGLMDPRGQLMLEYVRAVREIQPRWLLWENVPGVLSQDKGRAFGTLLSELDELGYGLAWRVLDSQFFGVPQRRRRVFLVGCFGSGGGASAVLFEREGVFGHPTSSRKKREELAASIGRGAQGTGGGIAFAQNQRGEVRLAGGDGTVSVALASRHTNQQTHIAESRIKKDTQATHVSTDDIGPEELQTMAHDDRDAQPMVMASANSHAEIGTGGGRSYADGSQPEGSADSRDAITSNGYDVFPPLCATDGDKQFIDNQSIRGGRLLLEPR